MLLFILMLRDTTTYATNPDDNFRATLTVDAHHQNLQDLGFFCGQINPHP